jgi:hypothetical protein
MPSAPVLIITTPETTAQAAAADQQAEANQTKGTATMAAPDLDSIYSSMFAASAANLSADQGIAVGRARTQAERTHDLMLGWLTNVVSASTEPDTIAGLNTAIRTPLTVDQPGNFPLNTAAAAKNA